MAACAKHECQVINLTKTHGKSSRSGMKENRPQSPHRRVDRKGNQLDGRAWCQACALDRPNASWFEQQTFKSGQIDIHNGFEKEKTWKVHLTFGDLNEFSLRKNVQQTPELIPSARCTWDTEWHLINIKCFNSSVGPCACHNEDDQITLITLYFFKFQ